MSAPTFRGLRVLVVLGAVTVGSVIYGLLVNNQNIVGGATLIGGIAMIIWVGKTI